VNKATGEGLSVERLYHTGVVVRNARDTARNYADLFGVTQWKVFHCGPKRLGETLSHGLRVNHSFTCAYGVHAGTGIAFQLIEPHGGDASTFNEFLATRGEGIHHICTTSVSPDTFIRLKDWFASKGVKVGQSDTIDGAIQWHLFDTRESLGGFYLMVLVPLVDDWASVAEPDEAWDLSDEVRRPEGVHPIPLARVDGMHLGVVVKDVVASMRRYADLLGLPEVSFFEVGTPNAAPRACAPMVTLGRATYQGAPVEHRILTSLTPVADFALEVLQVTVPPIHYKEDFFDRVGEGIHHFYATELSGDAEFEILDRWLKDIGVRVVQSGEMNCGAAQGLGEYFYLDTAAHLGGFVLEVIIARQGFWESFAVAEPTFTVHYAAAAE